jgi:4-amino-4-deoxy-L-arabinose transferase-like glycosyltransferase
MLTDRGALLGTFLLSLVFNAAFAPLGMMDFNHEAVLLIPAIDLVDGKMLFRDSFSQYGPVPIILQAIAISLFGKYVIVAKLQVALAYAITSVALYASWRLILGMRLALLSVLLWNLLTYHFLHVFLAWASAYALMFQCVGLFLIMRFAISGNRLLLIGVGACVMLAILSKQNVGFYFFGATVASLVVVAVAKRRPLLTALPDPVVLLLGMGLVLAPYLAWLDRYDAIGAWWLDNFIWPRRWSAVYSEQFSLWAVLDRLTAFRIVGSDPYSIPARRPDFVFVLMPLMTLGITAYLGRLALRGDDRAFLPPTLTLCLVSLASWLQFFPIPGIGHVWWSCAPMFGLFVWVTQRLSQRFMEPAVQHRAIAIVLVLVFAVPVFHRINYFLAHQVFTAERYVIERGDNPLRGMILSAPMSKFVGQVEAAIRAKVGKNPEVLLDSAEGIYLAFIDKPAFFHPLWSVPTPEVIPIVAPDYPELRDRFIKDRHPFVIIDSWLVEKFLAAYPDYKVVAEVEAPPVQPPFKFVLLH